MSRLLARQRDWMAVWMVALIVAGMVVTARPAAAATATVDRSVVATGGTITVRTSGYTGEEAVVTWASSARGTVYATEGAYADGNGNVIVTVSVRRFWEAGWWAITVRGLKSGVEAVATFQVEAGPPDGGLDISTTTATPGTTINFHGAGFKRNELVSAWVTRPDGTAEVLAASPITATGPTGDVWFSYTIPAGAAPGTWYVTTYGNSSDRLLVTSFTVGT